MSAFDKRSKDFEGANLSESEDLGQSLFFMRAVELLPLPLFAP